MTAIPKLVREKIDFYLDEIYQKRWQENIKIMHQQYKIYVHIEIPMYNELTSLYWFNNGNGVSFYMRIRQICILHRSSTKHWISRFRVSQFTGKQRPKSKLPQKYYFSSGLNHLYAYK